MYIPKSFERDSALVDWCEDNYVYSDYIAEFYNTISSFMLALYPVIMLLLSHGYTRFYTSKSYGAWMLLFVVGVASVYYHATLSLAGQLVDEISILWLLVYTLAIWLPTRYYDKYMQKATFQICCSVAGIVITILSPVSPALNAFCLLSSGGPFFYIIIREVNRLNDPVVHATLRRLFFFFFTALGAWLSDRFHCNFWQSVNFPYMHSFWHVFIAAASHEVLVMSMHFQSIENWKDTHCQIVYWPRGFPKLFSFPYVKMTPLREVNNNNDKNFNFFNKNGLSNGYSSVKRRNVQ